MELRNFRMFLALLMPLLFILSFSYWNIHEQKPPAYSFVVKVPPLSKYDDAPEEVFYWEFQKFLFPQIEIPNPIPKGVPNFCGLLYVSLEKSGNIKVNSQDMATLENTTPLTEKLNGVFRERENIGVYEPNSNEIVKAVIIKAPRSVEYGKIVRVIGAIKSSGADPIILQIDDLPQ